MRSSVDKLLSVGMLVTIPLVPLSGLALLNSVNPMLMVFLHPIEIVNRTGRSVEVTPIGAWEGSGDRGALPLYISERIGFAAPSRGNFSLENGESIQLVYDSDDINLTDVVAVDESGEIRTLVINRDPPLDKTFARPGVYVIPDFSELEVPDARVIDAASNPNASGWVPLLSLLPLVAPLWFLGLLFCIRRHRGSRIRES